MELFQQGGLRYSLCFESLLWLC